MYTYTHKSLGIVGYRKGKCKKAIKSARKKGKKVCYKIYTDKQISEIEEVLGEKLNKRKDAEAASWRKENKFPSRIIHSEIISFKNKREMSFQ